MECYHRSFARISLDAIEENFHKLRSCLPAGVKACAVVKADAYGHGSVPVSKRLEPVTDWFAVAALEEGIVLREAGIRKPILILSYTHPSQYPLLLEYGITPTLYNVKEAELLSRTSLEKGLQTPVHVAVDTGMGRIGFLPNEKGADSILAISRLPGISVEGLFSHYATADSCNQTEALRQTREFEKLLDLLEERGVAIPIKHICNSAGSMKMKNKFDMCRFGIAMYGLAPSDEVSGRELGITPAMEVFSHVVHVKEVPAGTKIGYSHTYTAPEKRVIATVSIGYADGFNRCLSGVGSVLISGRRAPIVGRVCMDQIMVDVTGIPDVIPGALVTIIGCDGEEEITAEEFGSLCHSFNYEVVCTFMPRVLRVYE
ncbi:MAG: alanine racemase [Clostridia bacterium]|nr:alanine racemase [Clostridia bacterium]